MSSSIVVTVKDLRDIADQDEGILAILEKYPNLADEERVRLTFAENSLRVDLLTKPECKEDYPKVEVISCGGMTMVGYQKEIGTFGNCWSAMLKNDKKKPSHDEHQVVNIGWESLEATGVPFPLEGILINGRIAITDRRIPPAAFRTEPCTVHADTEPFQIWKDMTADA